MLAADLAEALDPVEFALRAGLEPDPWQSDFLRSSAQQIILNCCRQSGKSTAVAVLAVHTAIHRPDSLVLMLSPSLRQSQELFKKCLDLYRGAGRPIDPKTESALRLELQNHSRIISLPGKEGTVRGFSGVDLLAIDEAARVPDDLYFALRPMLAVSGGRLVVLSTPFGTRGWFYESWRSEGPWERYEVPATECPRISPEFLAEERRTLGEWWFAQEFECTFSDSQSQIFTWEEIDAAFEEEVEAWAL